MEEVVEASSPGRPQLAPLAGADHDARGQRLDVFWDYEIDRRIRSFYNAPLL